jgi:hypothetical protein
VLRWGKSRVVFVKAGMPRGDLNAKDASTVGSSSKGSHRTLSRLHLSPACIVVGAYIYGPQEPQVHIHSVRVKHETVKMARVDQRL